MLKPYNYHNQKLPHLIDSKQYYYLVFNNLNPYKCF